MLSVVCVEVPAGSTMFPFFTVWGVLVVWPLYLLHCVFFAGLVFRYGKPGFWALFAAGMLFGMYEAYITKVVWTSFRPQGPFFRFGGIALFETLILVLFLHPLLAFVIPMLFSEMLLTSSNEVFLGFPQTVRRSVLRCPALWLGGLVTMFGLMQFINSPSVVSSLLSGVGNGVVLGLAVFWWRKKGGAEYTLGELLPGPRGLRNFGLVLLAWYLFWGFVIKPKAVPAVVPGQLTVWLIYAVLLLIFYRVLARCRHMPIEPGVQQNLPFTWKGFVLCFILGTTVTALARLLLLSFAAVQIAVFFSFYVVAGLGLLACTIFYAVGSEHAPGVKA